MSKTVNVLNKPTLMTFSTKDSTLKDSSLSEVEWGMRELISVRDGDHVASLSLFVMSFFNVFNNITLKNNKIKILSTWTNEGVAGHDINPITIPVNNYATEQLFNYINPLSGSGPAGSGIPTTTYYYGLGNAGDSTLPAFKIATTDVTKLQYTPPSIAALNATYNTSHVYTGFYLLIDADTLKLMENTGVVEYDANGNIGGLLNILDPASSTQLYGLGFPVTCTAGVYSYTNASSKVAPDCIALMGPISLNIGIDTVSANTRNSYSGLSLGDTIAVVPIVGGVGYKTVYEPMNPFKCLIPGFSTNNFRLTVRDSATGEKVDFQGVDWVITLLIDYLEVDNDPQGQGKQGNFDKQLPMFHGQHMQIAGTTPGDRHVGMKRSR